jgi:hypothetical protein
LLPREVDQFLMALDRVGDSRPCQEEQDEDSDRFSKSGAVGGGDRWASFGTVVLHTV